MENRWGANARVSWFDPGLAGHLRIEPHKTKKNTYLLSTEKWPDWYFYCKNWWGGNMRGIEGNPGYQGYFEFVPIDQA